jgi:hypothetical protein
MLLKNEEDKNVALFGVRTGYALRWNTSSERAVL